MRTIRGKGIRVSALLCGAAMALPLWAAPALAQGSAEALDSSDIIVTAQRRNEKLEDVPMSVAVVTAETLANAGVNSVRDLANVTSGFQLNQSGVVPQPAIRGVTTGNAGTYENNVALWVDGLYQITPQILNLDLPNVQAVQILKGPQGALYGRNATGGAILLDTMDPGDLLTGNLEATYGRFGDRRMRGFIAAPLNDKVGVSLAGTYRKTDGYYKKVSLTDPTVLTGNTFGMSQQSLRAKIKAELTDAFKVTVGYNYTRSFDPRGAHFTPSENLTAGFAVRQRGETATDQANLDFKQHEGMLKLELDTGIGTLRSVTGYQKGKLITIFDQDGRYSQALNAAADAIADVIALEKTWQENLDFTITAIDKFDLILGFNYFHNTLGFDPAHNNINRNFPNATGGTLGTPLSAYLKFSDNGYDRTKASWSGFFDATFHATDRLTFNVGGRYSEEKQNIHTIRRLFCTTAAGCLVSGATVPLGGMTSLVYDASASSKYSKFTPRASIRYELAPRTNVYFSYSQGFKAGEWNGVIPGDDVANWDANGEVGQETIDAFEVGLKSGGGRLRFDLSGFYYKYKNQQISSIQFLGSTVGVLLQAIPKSRIYGLEGNAEFDVTDNFKIRAGATWLNAKYGEGAIYRGTAVTPVANPAVPNPSDPLKSFPNLFLPPAWQNLAGLQMVRAPDFSGFLGFEYNIPKGEGGIRFSGNVKYTSSYVPTDAAIWGGETDASYQARRLATGNARLTPDNTQIFTAAGAVGQPFLPRASEQRTRQSGYALLNASVTWTDENGRLYARVWGNNLTNEIYATHYRPTTRTYIPIGEPRTFGGTIGVNF